MINEESKKFNRAHEINEIIVTCFTELMSAGCKIECTFDLIYNIISIIECCITMSNKTKSCHVLKRRVYLFQKRDIIK